MKVSFKFWGLVGFIWLIATVADRLWWHSFSGIPSWDQADYLNSALDHGRALGLLHGGHWLGWKALLDLSPKIPPLASLVNGSVMALAGDAPRQAAWSLSLWNGLLLVSVAFWGLHLRGRDLALLGVAFVSITPALLTLRSDYLLEMPLTAVVTLALWRLGCWWDPETGGRWTQAFWAAAAFTVAVLVKQSALLVLLPAVLWAGWVALRRDRSTRRQCVMGICLVLLGVLPWLKHNWITTIGGTKRAVIESAVREGDPSLFSLDNWTWYAQLLPSQVGHLFLVVGLSGVLLCLFLNRACVLKLNERWSGLDNKLAWFWLIFTLFAAWIFTSLSPNKGDRYIAPVLPSILLILARGWLQWGLFIERKWFPRISFAFPMVLVTGWLSMFPVAWNAQVSRLGSARNGPLQEIVLAAGGANPSGVPTTLIVVPSTPDLNQHNVSYYGRRNGGKLVGRQLGNSLQDIEPLLTQAQWVVLAEGDQGSVRESAAILDQAVRDSGWFVQKRIFSRLGGGNYSLWSRKSTAPARISFSETFPSLAKGLETGVKGLEDVFSVVAIQHMVDGHFEYQSEVRKKAMNTLMNNPVDIEARWTLALLAVLENRPYEASKQFAILEQYLPANPWPSAYRSAVILASWNPWKAALVADTANQKNPNALLAGLGDLSGVMGGFVWRLPSASKTIPKAIDFVEEALSSTDEEP